MAGWESQQRLRARRAWIGSGAASLGLQGLIRAHDLRLAEHLLRDQPINLTFRTASDEVDNHRSDVNELRWAHRRATEAVVAYIESELTEAAILGLAETQELRSGITTTVLISREAFAQPGRPVSIDGESVARQHQILQALHRSHTHAIALARVGSDGGGTPNRFDDVALTAFIDALAGPQGVTEFRPTFTRDACLAAVLDRLPTPVTVPEVLSLRDQFLDAEAIRLTGNADEREARYTTNDMLATELRVVINAVEGTGRGICIVDPAIRNVVLDHWERRESKKTLSSDRREALEVITGSGNAVDLLIGAAGAGKTKLMAAARDIWGAAGIETIGSAPTAIAAQRLHEKTGIRPVALHELAGADSTVIPVRSVVILDEAGTIPTRDLDHIMANAHAQQAKLVLVGDPHQMAPAAAGGALIALADRLAVVPTISNTRRQVRAWERSALLELRTGDIPTAVEAYRLHKRILGAQPGEEALELAAAAWVNASEDLDEPATALEQSAVIIAYGDARIQALTSLARQELRARGALTGPDHFADGELDGFACGDRIVLGFTAAYLDVTEGTFARISSIDADAQTVTVTVDASGKAQSRLVPAGHFARGEVRHAYAFDVREIQSRKVAHAIYVMGVHANREEAYSALSRGVRRNDIVLELPAERPAMTDLEVAQAFAGRLQRSGAPRTALDTLHAAVHPISTEQATVERIAERRSALLARIESSLGALEADDLESAERAALEVQLAQARRGLASVQKRLADLQRAHDSAAALITLGGVHTIHRSFAEFTDLDPSLSQRYGELAEQYAATSMSLSEEEILGDHVMIGTENGVVFEADFLVRGPRGVYIKEIKAGRGSLTKAQKRGHPAVAASGGLVLSGNFSPRSPLRPGTVLPPTPVVREVWR